MEQSKKLRGRTKRPDYIIEASNDGARWHRQTAFNNGDISRWNKPMDLELAHREFCGFKEVRCSGREPHYIYARLIVND